jgi:hypothetical protein
LWRYYFKETLCTGKFIYGQFNLIWKFKQKKVFFGLSIQNL